MAGAQDEEVLAQKKLDVVKAVRRFVGPHASHEWLLRTVTACSFNAEWVCNAYLRDAASSSPPDFALQWPRPAKPANTSATSTAAPRAPTWLHPARLPLDVLCCVAAFLTDPELIALECASAALRQALSVDAVWAPRLRRRYPAACNAVAATPAAATATTAARTSARHQFRQRLRREATMSCTDCGAARAVRPVLYGFPAQRLVELHRSGTIVLGGDHLLPSPVWWVCRACSMTWTAYPYQ